MLVSFISSTLLKFSTTRAIRKRIIWDRSFDIWTSLSVIVAKWIVSLVVVYLWSFNLPPLLLRWCCMICFRNSANSLYFWKHLFMTAYLFINTSALFNMLASAPHQVWLSRKRKKSGERGRKTFEGFLPFWCATCCVGGRRDRKESCTQAASAAGKEALLVVASACSFGEVRPASFVNCSAICTAL